MAVDHTHTAPPRLALGSGLGSLPTEWRQVVLTLDLADGSSEGLGRCARDLQHLSDNPQRVAQFRLDDVAVLSGVAAALSNLVSNVPAVLIFRPFLAHVPNPGESWLALAMSSTLAGNLTLLGSVANLIVVQHARRKVDIGFWEYARVGVPLTALTLVVGILWLR